MHRIEANILHYAKKRREQRQMKNINDYKIDYYKWQIKTLKEEIKELENKIKQTSRTE
jgi:hypothetical protein